MVRNESRDRLIVLEGCGVEYWYVGFCRDLIAVAMRSAAERHYRPSTSRTLNRPVIVARSLLLLFRQYSTVESTLGCSDSTHNVSNHIDLIRSRHLTSIAIA